MDMDGAEQRFPRAMTLGGLPLWGNTQLESSKACEKASFSFRVASAIYKHIFQREKQTVPQAEDPRQLPLLMSHSHTRKR